MDRLTSAGKSAAAAAVAAGVGRLAAATAALMTGVLLAAVMVTTVVVSAAVADLDKVVDLGREELIHGELEVLEQRAGVVGIAGAFFVRHTEVEGGDQQLNIPFQLNDAELPQGNKELTAFAVDRKIVIEAAADLGGDIDGRSVVTASVQDLAAQHNGIDYFHHCHRQVGALQILNVLCIAYEVGTEDAGIALAAKEHGAFVKDGKAAQRLGTAYTAERIQGHTVEVAHIHREKSTVISDGLYIDAGKEQFCIFGFYIDGVLQDLLGCAGQEHAQIPETFFFTARVIDFASMDTNSLSRRRISAERAGGNLFRHIVEPPE